MNQQTGLSTLVTWIAARLAFTILMYLVLHAHLACAESLLAPAEARADSYCCEQSAANAIDNNFATTWNAGRFPPASIIVDVGDVFPLSHVELLTAQLPSGVTEHRISVSNDGVSWIVAYTLKSNTADNQWLSLPINRSGRYIAVDTIAGPSWVAWKEIRVFQQPGTSLEYGFWDQGFVNAKIRTNYDSLYEGTASNPLTLISCLFQGCQSFPDAYSVSNAASFNLSSFADPQYWVLLDNNEPSDDNRCNSGAPDTSLPHSSPGEGIFGFAPIVDRAAGESFVRAHLVLNANFPNPCRGGIAYMSIGAHSNRGNVDLAGRNLLLGAVNASPGVPHTVGFVAKLYAYEPMDAALYRLVVVATWPDAQGHELPRMIQLNLFHDGTDDSSTVGPAKLRWSWPFAEDTFAPGAEVVYFDAEDLAVLCGGLMVRRITSADGNVDLPYDVDLQPLFECAAHWGGWSNEMPAKANIPITSVDWAVEGQGSSGALWVTVHNMRMH
jgi:F5/8 type C domain